MSRRAIRRTLFGALSALAPFLPSVSAAQAGWAVYYSDQASIDQLREYRLLVFDSDRHPPLPPLARGRTLIGYLSLAEIEEHRAYFAEVRRQGILIGTNPAWPGAYTIDVRNPLWRERVVRELVPGILAQGFKGIFLDTLDSAVDIESRDPEKYRGMIKAAAALVHALRQSFPSISIMMNRGYGLLPAVAKDIDILLGESVYASYDAGGKKYRLVPPAEYREQVRLLDEARRANPSLRVCTLDYWDPSDLDGIRRIYRVERSNRFEPYVATPGLDRLVREPR